MEKKSKKAARKIETREFKIDNFEILLNEILQAKTILVFSSVFQNFIRIDKNAFVKMLQDINGAPLFVKFPISVTVKNISNSISGNYKWEYFFIDRFQNSQKK